VYGWEQKIGSTERGLGASTGNGRLGDWVDYCFELQNEKFSEPFTKTSFEVEEIDLTCLSLILFRFEISLKLPVPEKTEYRKTWRRQHQDGSIDDRWTKYLLGENECSS
jgi:hypothetical protein